jgi:hypothetical protein
LIDAALDLPMQEKNASLEKDGTDAPINQSVGFALMGVEISQPTKAISVATMIPSQNLR